MKTDIIEFIEAFTRADEHINQLCSDYWEMSRPGTYNIPKPIMVKIISAFWEEYYNLEVTADETTVYIHFKSEADFTAFLLRWA
jgi:hypothetical protein